MRTTVAGIPCWVDVNTIDPYVPAYRGGHPDTWEPESGGEIDFTVCDRGGRPAPWLAAKMTDDDRQRIECEILEAA